MLASIPIIFAIIKLSAIEQNHAQLTVSIQIFNGVVQDYSNRLVIEIQKYSRSTCNMVLL